VSKVFPVLSDGQYDRARRRDASIPRTVPWEKVEPLRASCEAQHYQTLERLAERGGLGVGEFYIHAHGLKFRDARNLSDDVVMPWFKEWSTNV
jgi:hypothetical protein